MSVEINYIVAEDAVLGYPQNGDTGTAILRDTAAVEISRTIITANTSRNIEAPDGTVVIHDQNGNVLGTQVVKSNGSVIKVLTVGGACDPVSILVRNSNDVELDSDSVDAGGSYEYEVEDIVFVLNNSDEIAISSSLLAYAAYIEIIAPDGTVTINDQDGNLLGTQAVKSGGTATKVLTIGGGACDPVTIVVTNSASDELDTDSVASGGSYSFEAPDGAVVAKNSETTILATTAVKSNGSEDVVIADTSVQLLDSAAGDLGSTAIVTGKAGQTIAAPDASAVLKDTAGTTISTTALKSNESKDIAAPDGSVVAKNSETTILATTAVKSNGSEDVVIADTSVQLLDSAAGDLGSTAIVTGKAGQTIEAPDGVVNIEDQDGESLGSVTVKSGETKTETKTIDKEMVIELVFLPGSHTFPFDQDILSSYQVGTIDSFLLVNCSAMTLQYEAVTKTYTGTDFDAPFTTVLTETITIAALTITDDAAVASITLIGTHL